ncbi:hypothetical protein SLEP1_g14960 [Rubroshorea leprosula]|uniref:Uncharacterized protein n=1 Tax=Rubroshorea leprosula TaxID=152421 RepID=A0AAV5IKU1_9ROSI|nr:hypothetical protein SLEP1_g14960 [Rubroshorea leprosula]
MSKNVGIIEERKVVNALLICSYPLCNEHVLNNENGVHNWGRDRSISIISFVSSYPRESFR